MVSKSAVAVRQEKGDCIATSDVGFPKATDNQRPGNILTWAVTIPACAYIVSIGTSLYYSTAIFINMYVSMGVELRLSTKILIGFYRVMYPILFGGLAALVITKQFFVRDKWMSVVSLWQLPSQLA